MVPADACTRDRPAEALPADDLAWIEDAVPHRASRRGLSASEALSELGLN